LHLKFDWSLSSLCTGKGTGRLRIMSDSPWNIYASRMLFHTSEVFIAYLNILVRNIRMKQIVLRQRESDELARAIPVSV
jgi:hypothetical protein